MYARGKCVRGRVCMCGRWMKHGGEAVRLRQRCGARETARRQQQRALQVSPRFVIRWRKGGERRNFCTRLTVSARNDGYGEDDEDRKRRAVRYKRNSNKKIRNGSGSKTSSRLTRSEEIQEAAARVQIHARSLSDSARGIKNYKYSNDRLLKKENTDGSRFSQLHNSLGIWNKEANKLQYHLNVLLHESPSAIGLAMTEGQLPNSNGKAAPLSMATLLASLIDVLYVISGRPFTLDLSLYRSTSHTNYLRKRLNDRVHPYKQSTIKNEDERVESAYIERTKDIQVDKKYNAVAIDIMRTIYHIYEASDSLDVQFTGKSEETPNVRVTRSNGAKLPKLLKSMVMISDNVSKLKNSQRNIMKRLENQTRNDKSSFDQKIDDNNNSSSKEIPNFTNHIEQIVNKIMDMSRNIIMAHICATDSNNRVTPDSSLSWLRRYDKACCVDIGDTFWCFGKMRHNPGVDLIDAVVRYLTKRISSSDAVDLKMGSQTYCLLDIMDTKSLSLVMWFCGRIYYLPSNDALQAMMSASKSRMIESNADNGNTSAQSSDISRSLLDSLNISLILWTFATLGVRPDNEWLERASIHTAYGINWDQNVSKKRGIDLINTIWALSSLGYLPDEPVLESIMKITLIYVENSMSSSSMKQEDRQEELDEKNYIGAMAIETESSRVSDAENESQNASSSKDGQNISKTNYSDNMSAVENRLTHNVNPDREVLFSMNGIVRLFMSLTKWSITSAEMNTTVSKDAYRGSDEFHNNIDHNYTSDYQEQNEFSEKHDSGTQNQFSSSPEESLSSEYQSVISVRYGHRLWVPPNSLLYALCRDVKILMKRNELAMTSKNSRIPTKDTNVSQDDYLPSSRRAPRKSSEFITSQDISNLLWSFAMLEFEPDADCWVLIRNQLARLAQNMNAKELSMSLWALETLDYLPPQSTMEKICKTIVRRLQEFNEKELYASLRGVVMIGYDPGFDWCKQVNTAFKRLNSASQDNDKGDLGRDRFDLYDSNDKDELSHAYKYANEFKLSSNQHRKVRAMFERLGHCI